MQQAEEDPHPGVGLRQRRRRGAAGDEERWQQASGDVRQDVVDEGIAPTLEGDNYHVYSSTSAGAGSGWRLQLAVLRRSESQAAVGESPRAAVAVSTRSRASGQSSLIE